MKTLYVSDSFTTPFKNWTVPADWLFPGPFNSELVYQPGQKVDIELLGAECAHIVYVDVGATQGTAMDVYLTLYDISQAGQAVALPDYRLKFLTEAGAEMSEAVVVNSITRMGPTGNYSPVSRRFGGSPIRVGGVAPATAGKVYQVGAAIRFFGNTGLNTVPTEYEYTVQGRETQVVAAPPPPPSGTLLLTMPDGTKWSVPATLVP